MKELDIVEVNNVSGGDCQCWCVHLVPPPTNPMNLPRSIGQAKSLEECGKACNYAGLVLSSC